MATKVTVTNGRESNIFTFGGLAEGEWFIYNEELYCKVAPSDKENNAFYPSCESCLTTFNMYDQVIPIDKVEIYY